FVVELESDGSRRAPLLLQQDEQRRQNARELVQPGAAIHADDDRAPLLGAAGHELPRLAPLLLQTQQPSTLVLVHAALDGLSGHFLASRSGWLRVGRPAEKQPAAEGHAQARQHAT